VIAPANSRNRPFDALLPSYGIEGFIRRVGLGFDK
jgi:hypothetical protein